MKIGEDDKEITTHAKANNNLNCQYLVAKVESAGILKHFITANYGRKSSTDMYALRMFRLDLRESSSLISIFARCIVDSQG